MLIMKPFAGLLAWSRWMARDTPMDPDPVDRPSRAWNGLAWFQRGFLSPYEKKNYTCLTQRWFYNFCDTLLWRKLSLKFLQTSMKTLSFQILYLPKPSSRGLFRLPDSRLQYNKNVPTVKPMARTSWRIMGIQTIYSSHDTVPWTEQ
jgi:hypothetical protein